MQLPVSLELLLLVALGGAVLGALVTALVYTRRTARLEGESSSLREQLKTQDALAVEREQAIEAATQSLQISFDRLAGESLSANSETFLRLAQERLGKLQAEANAELTAREKAITEIVRPITETLATTREQLQQAEKDRQLAFGAIDEQLRGVRSSHATLQVETNRLVSALQRPDVGGQWGEITLRRLVELAGMVEHCDFIEQESVSGETGQLRPDLVVKLPDRGEIIVDAKTPLDAYLTAAQATEDAPRKAALQQHAKNLRRRVRELANKNYWAQFRNSPDFVVMFIPGDQFLGAALNHDPGLLEDALTKRILLVTPTSLIALLKAVAYGWRQSSLTDNAEKIRDLAEDLHKRLVAFTEHVANVGGALNRSVEAYNKAVGSLERSVLPGARKFTELGVAERRPLATVEPIDKTTRQPAEQPEPVRRPKDVP